MQGALSPLPTSRNSNGVLLRVSADGKKIEYAGHSGGAPWDNIYSSPRETESENPVDAPGRTG